MQKSPLDMEYKELDNLLDSLLDAEGLPTLISHASDAINYQRRGKLFVIVTALFRLAQAEMVYVRHMRKQIRLIREMGPIYTALKKTGCFKSARQYLQLSKIGQTDLLRHLGGRFDDKIFINFTVATMLYDAAFDVPICRKYLRSFDECIMNGTPIEAKDAYMNLFNVSVNSLRNAVDAETFEMFAKYIKIEHISQLMSIYQLSDKAVSRNDLLKITFSKGGIAFLALSRIMVPKMSKKEIQAVYELGAVLQLIDDIKDVKEDLEIGIQTLPNQKLLSHQELQQLYFGTVNNFMKQCDIDPKKPNGTLDMLCLFGDVLIKRRYGSFTENK